MNLSFSSSDFSLMREALNLYLDEMYILFPRGNEDILLVESTARKLHEHRKQNSMLSPADIHILTFALRDFREKISEQLDFSLSGNEREVALKTQRACNDLLRQFRKYLEYVSKSM